jgi:hypothetical protein
MFFPIIRAAISRSEVSGFTVATSCVMMPCAFNDDLRGFIAARFLSQELSQR